LSRSSDIPIIVTNEVPGHNGPPRPAVVGSGQPCKRELREELRQS
jgi:hypothetical protein